MWMLASDKATGMVGALAEVPSDAAYQRCTVHFCRNVFAKVPKSKRKIVQENSRQYTPRGPSR